MPLDNRPASDGRSGLLQELRRRGLDSERDHLRCWLGRIAPRSDDGRWSLGVLEEELADGWACALRGRILALRGEMGAASKALGRAVELLPREAVVRAWRGELSLLRGDLSAALDHLDRAVGLDPSYPWAYVYRSAARFRLGDRVGARRDVRVVARLAPRSAAGCILRAVLNAQDGRKGSAILWLDRALERGRHGWIYALRGTMRAHWNELAAARSDMDRALSKVESPWLRMERARIARQAGEFWTALKDLKKASIGLPHSCDPHLMAAAIHLDQAHYAHALDRLSRALELKPRDPAIRQQRARVYYVQGRLGEAKRDIETACRLSPGDHYLRQERIQILILRGMTQEAEGALKGGGFPEGVATFWRGYMSCRRKRFHEARDYFALAEKELAGGADGLSEKARFYGWVARALERSPAPKPAEERELSLVGLGYRHPFQVSLGALQALSEAEIIYSNLSDRRVADFLGLFPVPACAIVFRGLHQQARDSARVVMSGFARARRVAMVTRGQPLIYGLLAYRIVERCRRRGIPCRVPSSVSIFENMASIVADSTDSPLGFQVRDSRRLDNIDTRLPLVVYKPVSEHAGSLLRSLFRQYPPDHPCYLMSGGGDSEFVAAEESLATLRAALNQYDPACTLYLPPRLRRP